MLLSGTGRDRRGRGLLLQGGELRRRRVLLNSFQVLKSVLPSNTRTRNRMAMDGSKSDDRKSRRRKGEERGITSNTKQIKVLQHSFLPRSKQNRQIPIPRTLEKSIKSLIRPHHIQNLEYCFRLADRRSTLGKGFVFLFCVDVFIQEVSVYAGDCQCFCGDFDVV